MPYIKKDKRAELLPLIDQLARKIDNEGDINFAITELIGLAYITRNGTSYSVLNSAIGILECAKLELYRRAIAPYEDLKINQDGDIPSYHTIDREIDSKRKHG